ncbi:MAG: hypothetical protein ABI441_14830 [Flavobacterium sp.]
MKKKVIRINLFMSFTVLFAMLFQTLHSYEHIYTQITQQQCDHKYAAHEKQITHSHSVENNCPICHFTFSTFIPDNFQPLSFHKIIVENPITFCFTKAASTFFKGSLFALRAPPSLA